MVGFVLNRPARILGTETFFPELLSGIQLGLSPSHIALHMLVVSSVEEEVETYREWWHAHRVDGVILVDPRADDPRIRVLDELGMPAVQIGSHASRVSWGSPRWYLVTNSPRMVVSGGSIGWNRPSRFSASMAAARPPYSARALATASAVAWSLTISCVTLRFSGSMNSDFRWS